MRKVLFAALAVAALASVSTTSAEAWGGCGPYRHPTPWGCRLNGGYYGGGVVYGHPWGWHGYGWHGYGWHHYGWHHYGWHHW